MALSEIFERHLLSLLLENHDPFFMAQIVVVVVVLLLSFAIVAVDIVVSPVVVALDLVTVVDVAVVIFIPTE